MLALRPARVNPATSASSDVAVVGAPCLRAGTGFGVTLLVVGGQAGAEQVAKLGGARGGLTEGGLHVGDVPWGGEGVSTRLNVAGHHGSSFHGVMPFPGRGRC